MMVSYQDTFLIDTGANLYIFPWHMILGPQEMCVGWHLCDRFSADGATITNYGITTMTLNLRLCLGVLSSQMLQDPPLELTSWHVMVW